MQRLLLLLLCSFSILSADEGRVFMGVGIGGGDGNFKRVYNGSTLNRAYNVRYADINIGDVFESYNRFEASISTIETESEFGDYDNYTSIDLRYIVTTQEQEDDTATFFVSVGVGISYWYGSEVWATTQSSENNKTDDLEGVSSSIGIGVYLNFRKGTDIEISYRRKLFNWDDYSMSNVNYESKDEVGYFYIGLKIHSVWITLD